MITVTRQSIVATPDLEDAAQHNWPLKVSVTAENGDALGPKIFVYHAAKHGMISSADLFECVASVQQMSELPVDGPVFDADEPGEYVPYYRLDYLNFDCRSPEEADALWAKIKDDIEDLTVNFRIMNQTATEETVTFAT